MELLKRDHFFSMFNEIGVRVGLKIFNFKPMRFFLSFVYFTNELQHYSNEYESTLMLYMFGMISHTPQHLLRNVQNKKISLFV